MYEVNLIKQEKVFILRILCDAFSTSEYIALND
jgi:hypothetical protein